MVFPRILSVAERGWHKAPWEDILDDKQQRNRVRDENWEEFANTLGYKELLRLDDVGISYNVPIPGAKYVFIKYGLLSQYHAGVSNVRIKVRP